MADITNVPARLRAFVGLDDDVRLRLKAIKPVLDRAIPDILDRFYARVLKEPQLKELVDRNAAVDCLKRAQRAHWDMLLEGRLDDAYFERAAAIGGAHHRIGLGPDWYLSSYTILLGELVRAAVHGRRQSRRATAETIDALVRAVVFDMERATSVYLTAANATLETELKGLADEVEHDIREANGLNKDRVAAMHEAVDDLGRAAHDTGATSAKAATASKQSLLGFANVSDRVNELVAAIGTISDQLGHGDDERTTGTAVGQIRDLDARARNIGEVVDLISDIARRTNLLALNATIEAARAGPAGRGFAVVAQEVQTLAQQTADATERVTRQIEAIQRASLQVTAAINDVSSALAQQRGTADDMRHNLGDAATSNQEVNLGIQSVAADAQEVDRIAAGVRAEVDAVDSATRHVIDRMTGFLNKLRTQRAFDRRTSDRATVAGALQGVLIERGQRRLVAVLDLSVGGAALADPSASPIGAAVTLELNGVDQPISATVMGSAADRLRLRFDADAEQVAMVERLVQRLNTDRHVA